MKTALLLIDIQNIYFAEGNYKLYKPEEASLNAAKALDFFRKNSLPVIHIKHRFKTGKSEKENEQLCDIHENVKPITGETVIEKNYPSSFLKTDMLTELKKIGAEKLVVAGMMSHMCIDTTVRAAQDYGFEILLLEDCCTTKSLKLSGEEFDAQTVHKIFMASLDGTFAKVMKTDDFIKSFAI
jgi:nicotinamidase-related amidase